VPVEVTRFSAEHAAVPPAQQPSDAERPSQTAVVSSGKLASSALWRAIETAGTEAVAFLVFTTLARLLVPGDFGAVALATSIMTVLQGLLYYGFTEALIQKPDVSDVHHRTVLAGNFALSLSLVVLGLVCAWPLGAALERPEFPVIFAALLPSLLFRGFNSPMLAALRREMDFRSIALRTLLGVAVGGVIAVFLARGGAGHWALVVQQWSAEIIGFSVLAGTSPVKPWKLRWNGIAFRELMPVALPVMGAAVLAVAARRLDTFALGVYLPNASVGIYFMVYRLVFAAQMVTQHGLSEVAMVVLSSLNQDAERYRKALLYALRLMAFICACAFGLLAVAGPWLVPWVFGDSWLPATEPLRVLSALSLGGAIVSIAGVTLVASGYATAFSRLAIGSAIAQLLAVVVSARWGLMAVAWGGGIAQCLSVIPAIRMLGRYYQLSQLRLWAELAPIVGLFCAGLGLAHWVQGLPAEYYPQPLAAVAFAAVMGAGGLVLLRRERERAQRDSVAGVPPIIEQDRPSS
jgi:O-antigen/teichoic acid export membrane protein